jgi:hypothetical protein
MSTFKPGETYKTRDGREARVYAVDGGRNQNIIHGALLMDGAWLSQTWSSDGRMIKGNLCPEDLMPPKRGLWVNVYDGGAVSYGFACRDDADASAGEYRIARIRVEYTEGQFDD